MIYLSSTAIHAVNYNPTTKTLTVGFTSSGRGYDFYGVPDYVYQGLLNAASKGQFFNAYIRDQYAA